MYTQTDSVLTVELSSIAPVIGAAEDNSPTGTLIRTRVVRSPTNKDGYILKDMATGKVGFIMPPIDWEQVEAGQLWTAELLTSGPRYFKATLITLVKR